jgi:hypothetical protein
MTPEQRTALKRLGLRLTHGAWQLHGMKCPRIVYTDLDGLFCKVWFPSPACSA